jgi:hypothetical protein
MNDYRYILTPYKGPATRHRCPECNQPRKFSLYIDKETGEPLADHVGRCDREDRCGHHFTPSQYFTDNPQQATQLRAASYRAPIRQAAPRPVDYLPLELVEQSRRQLDANHLWVFFASQIGEAAANAIFEKYRVGTSKNWQGATAFWQIDDKGNARQCKVILYNPATGRRVKQDGKTYIAFMGKRILGNPDATLQQCLFGSHLLSQYPGARVAIVESEKTAMYCAHFYPNCVWLATGGKQGCRWTEKAVFDPLRGRAVVLFPDLMATADWQAKAEKVKAMVSCKIHVSTDLEAMATDAEKAAGLDLMDYHLQQVATQQQTAPDPSPVEYSCIVKKEPPPSPDGHSIPIKPEIIPTASNNEGANETAGNDATGGAIEYFTFDWFVSEARRWFGLSMVKDAKDYYPAFIASYRPTLNQVGIDETALRDALIL